MCECVRVLVVPWAPPTRLKKYTPNRVVIHDANRKRSGNQRLVIGARGLFRGSWAPTEPARAESSRPSLLPLLLLGSSSSTSFYPFDQNIGTHVHVCVRGGKEFHSGGSCVNILSASSYRPRSKLGLPPSLLTSLVPIKTTVDTTAHHITWSNLLV